MKHRFLMRKQRFSRSAFGEFNFHGLVEGGGFRECLLLHSNEGLAMSGPPGTAALHRPLPGESGRGDTGGEQSDDPEARGVREGLQRREQLSIHGRPRMDDDLMNVKSPRARMAQR